MSSTSDGNPSGGNKPIVHPTTPAREPIVATSAQDAESVFEELKRYIGFDVADAENVRALGSVLRNCTDGLCRPVLSGDCAFPRGKRATRRGIRARPARPRCSYDLAPVAVRRRIRRGVRPAARADRTGPCPSWAAAALHVRGHGGDPAGAEARGGVCRRPGRRCEAPIRCRSCWRWKARSSSRVTTGFSPNRFARGSAAPYRSA